MKRLLCTTFLLASCGNGNLGNFTDAGPDMMPEPARSYRFALDDAAPGALPSDWVPVLGEWTVAEEASAPSPKNVVRQSGKLGGSDFPRVLIKGLSFDDLTVKVRCRPERGDVDRACGLIFRAVDSNNYYLTRANALENNVRLYHVIDGSRSEIAGADLRVTANEWHGLEVTATGDELVVRWDGSEVIRFRDQTFTSGKIGLWTKADSVTAFDDLEAVAP